MRTMKHLLLVLVTLVMALTAVPAAAERDREQEFRRGHRDEWVQHEGRAHDRWDHDRWAHHDSRFASRVPRAAHYCSRQGGYWAWDGWQQVWVPPQTVCE
jgi:hypothetical protein